MKSYPSIQSGSRQHLPSVHVFEKADGSNIRVEWNRKSKSWSKFGTRTQLLSPEDPTFGPAIPVFEETLSEPLTKIAIDKRWESCVVFAEYFGPSSFAGQHIIGEPMQLLLFDISPYKKGIVPPEEFLELTEDIAHCTVNYYGRFDWNNEFVERVRAGEIDAGEGVIGKKLVKNNLIMYKAKTQTWYDKVKARYSPEQAEKIINS